MRISTLIIIALLTILTVSIWQNGRAVDLDTLRKTDPVLDQAVDAALNQNSDEALSLWLAEQNEFDRRLYYKSALLFAYQEDPKNLSDREECKRIYENRFLFTPFFRISIGNSNLDIEIDNLIGYSLVFGPNDNNERASVKPIIEKIAKRLEKATAKNPSAQIQDTIACIYFELGDKDKALKLFKQVLELIPDSGLDHKIQSEFKDLVQRRIQAIKQEKPVLPLE